MPSNVSTGVPVPQAPIAGAGGSIAPIWWQFFNTLWNRTGGASGSASGIIDTITNVIGSILYRSSGGWLGLAPGMQYKTLRMGADYPEWDTLDGNSFAAQAANSFFAGPPAGGATVPTFRILATADLDSIAGQIPGTAANDNASAGNVGEYVSATIASGNAVALTSTQALDIASITLTPGDWDVWINATFAGASSTTIEYLAACLTETSDTFNSTPGMFSALPFGNAAIFAILGDPTFTVGPARFSIAAQTTIHFDAQAAFGTSTCSAYGIIQARRVR